VITLISPLAGPHPCFYHHSTCFFTSLHILKHWSSALTQGLCHLAPLCASSGDMSSVWSISLFEHLGPISGPLVGCSHDLFQLLLTNLCFKHTHFTQWRVLYHPLPSNSTCQSLLFGIVCYSIYVVTDRRRVLYTSHHNPPHPCFCTITQLAFSHPYTYLSTDQVLLPRACATWHPCVPAQVTCHQFGLFLYLSI
jgi:hypothetical protein